MPIKKSFFQSGVTLIELIVVLSILGLLLTLTTINVTKLIPKANISATVDTMIADIKAQQQKAMLGETEGASTSQPFGVHIDQDQYVLYAGSTYSSSNTANSLFPTINTVQLSTTFSGGNILFSKGSGEISGYVSGSNTITMLDTATGETKTIQLNQYGVITTVN